MFFFALVLLPAIVYQVLHATGFLHALYGADFDFTPAAADRRILWVSAFAFPFQLAAIIIILGGLNGARLYQLGLVRRDAAQNIVLGWLAWFLFTPPVLLLNVLATGGYRMWEGEPPEEHPLLRLAKEQPLRIEWILIGVTSIFMAPVLEELLFRRVLQGWAAERPWGGPITLLVAFAWPLVKLFLDNDTVSARDTLHALESAVFVLLVAAGCLLLERRFRHRLRRPYVARAVYSTALLFGVFHPWPTPIPLFVLGLVLGYLAYRTQNLLAPMVMHALFNGVACLVLLRGIV